MNSEIDHRFIPVIAGIIMILTFSACNLFEPEKETERTPPREITVAEKELVSANNAFGFNLFRTLNETAPDSNLFISPLSVSMALGMTLNGAADSTYEAMKNTLALTGLTEAAIHQSYRSLIDLLTEMDPKVVFQIANSIWYRQGFTVEQPFLDANQKFFDSEVKALDFNDPESVDIINGWVDEKTHGKIEEIIESIDPTTVMYLINAIYFKGQWLYEFDKAATKDQPFYNLDGSTSTVPLMALEGTLPMLVTDTFTAVDIPYGDSLFSMTVLLPHEGEDINAVAHQLNTVDWNQLVDEFQATNVQLFLPRFKVEYFDSLKKTLSAMGMGIAFTWEADFSRINPTADLYIDDVLHKTFVEVNEEGTEAAAVTAVVIYVQSANGGSTFFSFRVDRPFVFAIRERHSGAILFIGKIVDLVS